MDADIKILKDEKEKVIIAGIHTGRRDYINDTTEESMRELTELVETAGGEVVGELIQNRPSPDSGTYLGEGKLEELKNAVETLHADLVVFDDEMSPAQLRNVNEYLKVRVLDRSMLILDIFAMRARSGEGKLQVELAQLKYQLPRLHGWGLEMHRLGAGIGTRGPGETQLEIDRRHIRTRISALEAELKEVKKHRELLRTRRVKDGVITCALVGYTNAGKSTLLNRLTDAGVFAEDKLFATLDTTSRQITLDDNRKIILIDTVGFIRKLPHYLVEAFKSTLEEAATADFLLHIIDVSADETDNQIQVVENVLEEIGAGGKPTVNVYNKCDINPDYVPADGGKAKHVYISAKTGQGIDKLIRAIADTAPGKKTKHRLLIPYSDGGVLNELHSHEKILSEEYTAEGTMVDVLLDNAVYGRLKQYALPEEG
ncbi:MAG: GTPase HflX [Oscillospiraceae bacterium]|nr:GTPase HflX [Oscillospiraceae bacterium]